MYIIARGMLRIRSRTSALFTKKEKCPEKLKFAIYESTFFVYNKSGNENGSEEIRMKAQWNLMLNNPTEVSGTYCSFFSIPSICYDDCLICFISR